MPETHINALYADLATAKQTAAIAQGKVAELEDQIVGRGGELPADPVSAPEASPEDVASANDVSAAESKPKSKKGKK